MHLQNRRTLLRWSVMAAVTSAATLSLPAQAGFNFFTGVYTATQAQLMQTLARQFPQTRNYAGLVQLHVSDPQLSLDAPANRLRLRLMLQLSSPFLGTPVQGQTTLSSSLRYDASTLSLRLEQPRAEQLQLQGLSGTEAERLQRIAAAVAQELLQGQALHTFAPEDLRFGLKTYNIGAITVLPDAVQVQLY